MHKKHNESQNKTIVYCSIVVAMSFLGWRDIYVLARFWAQRSRDVWIWCEITCWRQETFCVLMPRTLYRISPVTLLKSHLFASSSSFAHLKSHETN
jgi:hypothetical protein